MAHPTEDFATRYSHTTGDVPARRVGASSTVVGAYMYLFGGHQVDERKIAGDLYRLDLQTLIWEKLAVQRHEASPTARYFHSAAAWGNKLIICGGLATSPDSGELCAQNDVCMYDTEAGCWILGGLGDNNLVAAPQARYGHLSSVTADRLFIIGGQDEFATWLDDICVYDLHTRSWGQTRRHPGVHFAVAAAPTLVVHHPPPDTHPSTSDALVFHPFSAPPTSDHTADVHLYSYSRAPPGEPSSSAAEFWGVHRDLQVISARPDVQFKITDRSETMSDSHTLPPVLRGPRGAILGDYLVMSGTYLSHTGQAFAIWALDLKTMQWSLIETMTAGSWSNGCLAPSSNQLLVFGSGDQDDSSQDWGDVAIVELEAFGIYQPPPARLDTSMQELGLLALEEGVRADFEVICEDGRKVPCSRKLFEERWPWFREQRRALLESALQPVERLSPDIPSSQRKSRVTARALHMHESYPVTLALVQYFYAQGLITPLQQSPAVLNRLLVIATDYDIAPLVDLAKHAIHCNLSCATAVGVYETAMLCRCQPLQLRAAKIVHSLNQNEKEHDASLITTVPRARTSSVARSMHRERGRSTRVQDMRAPSSPIPPVPSLSPSPTLSHFPTRDMDARRSSLRPEPRRMDSSGTGTRSLRQKQYEVDGLRVFVPSAENFPAIPPSTRESTVLSSNYKVSMHKPSMTSLRSGSSGSGSLQSSLSLSTRPLPQIPDGELPPPSYTSTTSTLSLGDDDESYASDYAPSVSTMSFAPPNDPKPPPKKLRGLFGGMGKLGVEKVKSRGGSLSGGSDKSNFSGDRLDHEKEARKAEEKEAKRRKAEEKRLRTERLAEDLKARSRAQKGGSDVASTGSGERKYVKKEPATMYGGFVM